MNSDAREIELLDGTIVDLQDLLVEMMTQRDKLDAEIRAKQDRLRQWQARRAKLGAAIHGKGATRRAKGENERAVAGIYKQANVPAEGLSVREIAKRTGLPWSSVHATLKRKGQYVESGGLWRPSQNGNHAQGAPAQE